MAEIFDLASKRRSDELDRQALALVDQGGVLEILGVTVARLKHVQGLLASVRLEEGMDPERVRADMSRLLWGVLDANIELLQLAQRRYPLEVGS